MCENIGAGDHTVRIRTTQCVNYNSGDYYTGWTSHSRMHIEEVRQSARLDAGNFKTILTYYTVYCSLSSEQSLISGTSFTT